MLSILIENVGNERDNTINFLLAVGKVFEKHRNVVIRILARIATCAGAKQHDAFEPVAIQFVERSAEALQDRVGNGSGRHDKFSIRDLYYITNASKRRRGARGAVPA